MTKSWKNKKKNLGKGRFRHCGFNVTSNLTARALERGIKTKPQHRSRVGTRVPASPKAPTGGRNLAGGGFTESQHGRGRKGPLWVTQPNPLPKQGHPEQGAQHRVQAGLEYLQRRRLHSLPGQLEAGKFTLFPKSQGLWG